MSNKKKKHPMEGKISSFTVFATEKCNMCCDYCFVYEIYQKTGQRFEGKDMSFDTSKATVDFMLKQDAYRGKQGGRNGKLSWHWFGGEPTIRMDLLKDTWTYATARSKEANKDIRWGMTTNAVALANDDIADWFITHQPFHFLISLDGWGESHDMHRKFCDGKGSFGVIKKGLDNIINKVPEKELEIRWTVSPDNGSYVFDSLKKLIKYGFRAFALDPVHEVEWSDEDLDVYYSQVRKSAYMLMDLHRKGIHIHFKPLRDGVRSIASTMKRSNRRCGMGMGSISVTPEGKLAACHRWVNRPTDKYNYILGDVWNGIDYGVAEEFWSKLKVENIRSEGFNCKNCPMKGGCIGGCLVVNYDQTGDMNIIPTETCVHERRKFPIAAEIYSIMSAEKNEGFFRRYGLPLPWSAKKVGDIKRERGNSNNSCSINPKNRKQNKK
jgi:uncharacterized protein